MTTITDLEHAHKICGGSVPSPPPTIGQRKKIKERKISKNQTESLPI